MSRGPEPPQMCPTSRAGRVMPTWRAAAQPGCAIAHHHQDTASLTDAHQQTHRCWEHFLSRNQMLGGQVQAKGPDPRARLQAAEAAKTTLPSKPSLLLPPSTTVGGKMHSSEESKFEQLSSNESFLPPRGCFIKLFVFFCWRWTKQQWKTPKKYSNKKRCLNNFISSFVHCSFSLRQLLFHQRFMNPWEEKYIEILID